MTEPKGSRDSQPELEGADKTIDTGADRGVRGTSATAADQMAQEPNPTLDDRRSVTEIDERNEVNASDDAEGNQPGQGGRARSKHEGNSPRSKSRRS